MNDADEPCQDLGRGLGSHKTGLSPPSNCITNRSKAVLLVRLILIGPEAGHFHIFCIRVRCYMMTYPFVRSIKLFDYRIKLWQPRTLMARANVSTCSSDRSELLLSLRFSYILVAAGGWFYPLPVIILEHAFPSTGFAVIRHGRSLQLLIFSPIIFCHFDEVSVLKSNITTYLIRNFEMVSL